MFRLELDLPQNEGFSDRHRWKLQYRNSYMSKGIPKPA